MGMHRRVTEEDLHVTEALIADSFGRLKRSIAEAPHEAIRPATDMIREHPFATTTAAAGAGVIMFQLAKIMFASRAPHKEAHKGRGLGIDALGARCCRWRHPTSPACSSSSSEMHCPANSGDFF
jgi:hypothetical protein